MELNVLHTIWREKFGFLRNFLLVFIILTLHPKIYDTAPAHHSTLSMDVKNLTPTTDASITDNTETPDREISNIYAKHEGNNKTVDSPNLPEYKPMPNTSVIDKLNNSSVEAKEKDTFNKSKIYKPLSPSGSILKVDLEEDLKYNSKHETNQNGRIDKMKDLSSPKDKNIESSSAKVVKQDTESIINSQFLSQTDSAVKKESNTKNINPAHLKLNETTMIRNKEINTHYNGSSNVNLSSVPKNTNETNIQTFNRVDETKPQTQNSTRRTINNEKEGSPIQDKIVKLIDLENHDSHNETIDGKKQSLENSGHDGIKITKKKQLITTHFNSTTDILESKENNTSTFVAKNKTSHHSLVPVHNGFLGPILMGEKTIPGPHREENHHQPIGSKLQNRTLVEIIAPTTLVRETTTSDADITTTTVETPELNKPDQTPINTLLSTTVFQVPDVKTTPTRFPSSTQFQEFSIGSESNDAATREEGQITNVFENDLKTESKISDIQIEVYDSTVDSIVSSTNFRENDGPLFEFGVNSTKPPLSPLSQEKFTQYVVDHTDYSTEESTIGLVSIASGRPEPAAIEIHINVSEGLGNDSEDLEFSYRQSDVSPKPLLEMRNAPSLPSVPKAKDGLSSERSDEVLVVEIIDSGDNNTENTGSIENFNINPIFTFRSSADIIKDNDGKYNSDGKSLKSRVSDDLFMPDVRKEELKYMHSPPPPPTPPKPHLPDRDSDTIFYISNTEVKVAESLPTINTNIDQKLKQNRLENQFFPVNYITSTQANSINKEQRRYEQDTIHYPIHPTKNAINIFSRGENIPPLDVTYVGESVMEVEQSSGAEGATSFPSSLSPAGRADVIIQPAILPEIAIGVPIIGELPPQIELKAIDLMQDETKEQRGNEIDRIVESSIQYGGDLINEAGVMAGGGFDGSVGSYPFGNPTNSRDKSNSYFTHMFLNNGASNLKKDQLVADVASYVESAAENGTMRELYKNGTELMSNVTVESAERIGNATAFSIMEDPSPVADAEINWNDWQTLLLACFATLLPLVVAVFLVIGLRYLYHKYLATSLDQNYNSNELANGKSSDTNSPDEHTSQRSKTEILPPIACTDVIIESTVENEKNSSDQIVIPSNVNYIPTEMPTDNDNIAVVHDSSLNASSNSALKSYTGPNGSITTMTLKHNHLIVETEERNDISRDARETKMHYNTAEKDGIFVVEVARGIDSKSMTDSPDVGNNQRLLPTGRVHNGSVLSAGGTQDKIMIKNHEEVQIHQPPLEQLKVNNTDDLQMILHQIVEVEEPIPSPSSTVDQINVAGEYPGEQSNTGLSQSDLSSTSSADSNKRYSYGNQELYSIEHPEYVKNLPKCPTPETMHRETTDDDHTSENGNNMERTVQKNNNQTADNGLQISNDGSSNEEEAQSKKYNPTQEQKNEILMKVEELEQTKMDNDAKEPVRTSNGIQGDDICESSLTNGNGEINKDVYDSILSLPDPPSTEEINKLNELSSMEGNQLDSLPPPSPPPPLVISTDVSVLKECAQQNGNIYHIENKDLIMTLPTGPSDFSCSDKIPIDALTPPSSPALRSHFSNGRNTNLTSIAVAVDVNGS